MKTLSVSILRAVFASAILLMLCSGIEKRYVSQQLENGALFHFFSQKMPAIKASECTKEIKYDFTYLEETDSVTFLSTIRLSHAGTPKSVTFTADSLNLCITPDILFVEARGNNLDYRLSAKLAMSQFRQLYASPHPYAVTYTFEQNAQDQSYSFAYPQKKWRKERDNVNIIIDIIDLNTHTNNHKSRQETSL